MRKPQEVNSDISGLSFRRHSLSPISHTLNSTSSFFSGKEYNEKWQNRHLFAMRYFDTHLRFRFNIIFTFLNMSSFWFLELIFSLLLCRFNIFTFKYLIGNKLSFCCPLLLHAQHLQYKNTNTSTNIKFYTSIYLSLIES